MVTHEWLYRSNSRELAIPKLPQPHRYILNLDEESRENIRLDLIKEISVLERELSSKKAELLDLRWPTLHLIARLVLATHPLQVAAMTYGYVYLLCNRKNGTLYLGTTTDLYGRLQQHKSHCNPKSFTAQHDITRLVWFERYDLVTDAIAREKTMNEWKRQWKINLIEENNSNWDELVLGFDDWGWLCACHRLQVMGYKDKPCNEAVGEGPFWTSMLRFQK